jgi:hypothetical protein
MADFSIHTLLNGPNPMNIGTLLTAAIVSLSTVGGGLTST